MAADLPTTSDAHAPPTGTPDTEGRFLAHIPAPRAMLALIVLVTLVRLVWLAFLSPYALSEDEAHYWEWAQRLDMSYYSKGPGIAWTIWLSTSLLGDTYFGVRAGAPLFGALAAWGVYLLGRRVYGPRVGLVAGVLVLLIPAYQVVGLLMTIDGPYLACWALSAWCTHRALIDRRGSAWVLLGLGLGVGFLYKYTILLLALGLVLMLIVHRRRFTRVSPWALGGLAVFGVCLLPVLIWNAQHDWVTVRHLLGHLGLAGGDIPIVPACAHKDGFFPLWTLEFVGAQAGIIGPVLILAGLGIARIVRTGASAGELLLLWSGLPVVVFYLVVSLFSEGEANWPIAGYFTLLPIAAREGVAGMDRLLALRARCRRESPPVREPANLRHVLLSACVVYGLVGGLGLLLLDPISKIPGVGDVARIDRLRRGPVLAARVLEEIDTLRGQRGGEPFVMGSHYGRVSLLAFEFRRMGVDGVEVFCASAVLPAFPEEGLCPGRRTQYDMWEDTNLRNPAVVARLRGRDAVLLGATRRQWEVAFESIVEVGGRHAPQDEVSFIGHGFRGFADPSP